MDNSTCWNSLFNVSCSEYIGIALPTDIFGFLSSDHIRKSEACVNSERRGFVYADADGGLDHLMKLAKTEQVWYFSVSNNFIWGRPVFKSSFSQFTKNLLSRSKHRLKIVRVRRQTKYFQMRQLKQLTMRPPMIRDKKWFSLDPLREALDFYLIF